jgi:hypothetical protein
MSCHRYAVLGYYLAFVVFFWVGKRVKASCIGTELSPRGLYFGGHVKA